MSTPDSVRQTSVHSICDQFVDDIAAAHPIAATFFGISGHDDLMPDYSPDGHALRAGITRRAVADVEKAEPRNRSERVAKAVFLERNNLELEIHEAGLDIAVLNVISSPVQEAQMVFDQMPQRTEQDWATIASRMEKTPDALNGIRASLLAAADVGRVSALRQVRKVADQADVWAGLSGGEPFFSTFVSKAENVPASLREKLERAARAANEAYAELAGFLRAELAPKAPTQDAAGEDVYRLQSRYFTGARLDLAEAYAWGWEEFARIETEMKAVANRIKPNATLAETAEFLNNDSRYTIHGRQAFEEWMQRLSDDALTSLRGTHFDLPDSIMTLECKIAPTGGGSGAYYVAPSADFSRPGRMWWSVPAEQNDFSTWREASTVYHEGVPGHHLQLGTAVAQAGTLNKYQRLMSFVSGHGEGWALYAERLMEELGYLTDDGYLLGMLDAQLFRAARVIIDIGMHLELEIPRGSGFHEGETWTPDVGLEFLLTRTLTEKQMAHDQLDRYLGWPGQAPAYKIGERLWLAARKDAQARQGADFDLKTFHAKALEMGGMGLDTLREQLAEI